MDQSFVLNGLKGGEMVWDRVKAMRLDGKITSIERHLWCIGRRIGPVVGIEISEDHPLRGLNVSAILRYIRIC